MKPQTKSLKNLEYKVLVNSKGQITIPKAVRKYFGIEQNVRIPMRINLKDGIFLKKTDTLEESKLKFRAKRDKLSRNLKSRVFLTSSEIRDLACHSNILHMNILSH